MFLCSIKIKFWLIILYVTNHIQKVLNFDEEKEHKKLIEYANKENVVIIAMIAPYVSVRISPVEETRAEIGISEEFGIEMALEHIKKESDSKKLILLVGSPGGYIASSYKVALALRDYFEHIIVFVPHIAASGGTLVALTGNEILGIMSNLTPLDVQTSYKDMIVSCESIFKSFGRLCEYFKDKQVEEAAFPYRALAEKLDPILMEEFNSQQRAMIDYVTEILQKTGYNENSITISESLVRRHITHGQVINYDKAKILGLKVDKSDKYPELWSYMREWLAEYMLKGTDKHFIRYIVPKREKDINNEESVMKKEVENG